MYITNKLEKIIQTILIQFQLFSLQLTLHALIHWSTASLRVNRFTLVFVELDSQGKENSIPFLISSSTFSTSAILSLAVTFDDVLNGICFSYFKLIHLLHTIALLHTTYLYEFLSYAITDSFS